MNLSFLKEFLLPPLNCLVLLGIGLLMKRRWRRPGITVATLAVVLLTALSTPWVGACLLAGLQGPARVHATIAEMGVGSDRAQAIVVLGAGLTRTAPEYGNSTVGPFTLVRLRYAARLHKQTGLPVLVTGGSLAGNGLPPARAMATVLQEEHGVPVRWIDENARNTWENALGSRKLLHQQEGADLGGEEESTGEFTICLVTHAWHMPRAKLAFEQAGLAVIEAPTGFGDPPRADLRSFLPSWKGVRDSALAIHEWIGTIWYRVRY